MIALAVGALMAFRLLLHPREVTTGTVIALLIGQNAVLLAIIWLVAVVYRGASLRQLGFVPASASWYRRVVPVAIFLQIVVILTNVLISHGLGKAVRKPADPADHAGPEGLGSDDRDVHRDRHRGARGGRTDAPQRPLWLAAEAMSPMIAGIISAAAFAALHGSLVLLPGTFLVGLTLAWTYERSGSIFPCMLVHGCFNAISTLLVFAVAVGQPGVKLSRDAFR